MRKPDKESEVAQAWLIQIADSVQLPDAQKTSLRTWLVRMPGVHAFWSNWMVNVCHLRPLLDGTQANKQWPLSTHEITISAIVPKSEEADCHAPIDVDAAERNEPTFDYLEPLDLVYQIQSGNDVSAITVVDMMVHWMLLGRIGPDSDFASKWFLLLPNWCDAAFAGSVHPWTYEYLPKNLPSDSAIKETIGDAMVRQMQAVANVIIDKMAETGLGMKGLIEQGYVVCYYSDGRITVE